MIMLFLALQLTLAPPQTAPNNAANNAVIEGRVLRAGTMDPIPNVQVTLVGPPPATGTSLAYDFATTVANRIQELIATGNQLGVGQAAIDNAVANLQASAGAAAGQQNNVLTDAAGHYSFKDQAPGKYTVRANLEGFFGPSINGSPSTIVSKSITIEAQKAPPAADLFMVKAGVISGRILDPNGQPASGITVAATRVTYSNGRPQWTTAISKQADDRGIYRIFGIGPGEYYVGFTPPNVSTVPRPQDSWARTYFPGVTDPMAATALTIKDGAEISGIDFNIQSVALTAMFKITGKAINPLAVPNATTGVVDRSMSSFVLSPREPGIFDSINPQSVQNALAVAARPNGEFEIRNVRPGSYDLIPYYMPPVVTALPAPAAIVGAGQTVTTIASPTPPPLQPVRRYYIDRAHIDVRNSDVDGISLTIQKGTELRGRVVAQGAVSVPLDRIRINLHSLDTIPEAFATVSGAITVDSAGDFLAPDIAAARYSLQISGLPATAYVADIRQGGTTIFDSGLTVGDQNVTTVDILVNSNGATIQGSVEGPDHKPAVNATVVLVPPASHRQNSMMYKTAQTDDTGSFSMKGIPPGEFNLFAWENVPPTAWMNSEFLKKFQNLGHPVNVTQGSRSDVQLELIADDFNRR